MIAFAKSTLIHFFRGSATLKMVAQDGSKQVAVGVA